jgi:hypothetical protein
MTIRSGFAKRSAALAVFALALAPATAHAAGGLAWSPVRQIDRGAPFAAYARVLAISCPSPRFCAAVGGLGGRTVILTSVKPTGGRGDWRRSGDLGVDDAAYTDVACVSRRLCVVTGDTMVVSADPGAATPHWHGVPRAGAGLRAVACASSRLCVAVGEGVIATSTDPASGSWRRETGPVGIVDVACPSDSLCVATTLSGQVLTSRHPAGGASTWSASQVAGVASLKALSCPSAALCVALGDPPSPLVDGSGMVVTATDPAGGAGAWHVATVEENHLLQSVACASPRFCIASDSEGTVLTSTDPTGGPGSWIGASVPQTPSGFEAVACPSASLCLAGAGPATYGLASSTSPASGAASWRVRQIAAENELDGVSCPSPSLCVAVDAAGKVATTRTPARNGPWRVRQVGTEPLISVSCPSRSVCAMTDFTGHVVSSVAPTAPAWTTTPMPIGLAFGHTRVECPTVARCIAGAEDGNVLVSGGPRGPWSSTLLEPSRRSDFLGAGHLISATCSSASRCVAWSDDRLWTTTNPAGGLGAWQEAPLGGAADAEIACPSASLCVAAGRGRGIRAARAASGPWRLVSGAQALMSVSCPSASFCAAVTYSGAVYSSTDPGRAHSWVRSLSAVKRAMSISCASRALCVVVGGAGDAAAGKAKRR